MISSITSSLQLLYASSHLASIAAMVSYKDAGSSGLLTGPRFVVKQVKVNMMRVDSARILILFFMTVVGLCFLVNIYYANARLLNFRVIWHHQRSLFFSIPDKTV